jgi:hypothetical protein
LTFQLEDIFAHLLLDHGHARAEMTIHLEEATKLPALFAMKTDGSSYGFYICRSKRRERGIWQGRCSWGIETMSVPSRPTLALLESEETRVFIFDVEPEYCDGARL